MTKTPIDYSKTIIYKICCKDPNIKDVYVGSTTNFRSRKFKHKSCCNNPNYRDSNLYVYRFIRENGGWQNWNMIMIKEYSKCESKQQCLKKERKYIEKLNATLNSDIPGRTMKEWIKDNKESVKQQRKRHYVINKERITKKSREYYNINKEKIKQKRNLKIKCECGNFVTNNHMSRHKKTKKHLDLLQQQNQ
jgi:ribosomal protein S27AE